MSMLHDHDTMTVDDQQKALSENLIPSGTYDGLVLSYEITDVDRAESPYYGKPIANVQAELYDVEGNTRRYFFRITNIKGLDKLNRYLEPSRLYAEMTKALGVSITTKLGDTLDQAKQTRLGFKIRKSEAKDGFDARNWTAIKATRG